MSSIAGPRSCSASGPTSIRGATFAEAFAGDDPLLRHVRTRVRSPQTNGVVERIFGTLKYEHLNRAILTDGDALAVGLAVFRQTDGLESCGGSFDVAKGVAEGVEVAQVVLFRATVVVAPGVPVQRRLVSRQHRRERHEREPPVARTVQQRGEVAAAGVPGVGDPRLLAVAGGGVAGAVDAEQVDRERVGLLERPPHRMVTGQHGGGR